MACVKPCIPIFISPIYIHMWKKKGFLALENVKLCSGDTVNPITVQHSVKVSFCVIVLFVKVIYIFILLLICQTKNFMVILTILCNFILIYCILFLRVHIYEKSLCNMAPRLYFYFPKLWRLWQIISLIHLNTRFSVKCSSPLILYFTLFICSGHKVCELHTKGHLRSFKTNIALCWYDDIISFYFCWFCCTLCNLQTYWRKYENLKWLCAYS